MEYPSIEYKDINLKRLVIEVKEGYKLINDMRDSSRGIKLDFGIYRQINEKTQILAKYLADNYPKYFKIYVFKYDEIVSSTINGSMYLSKAPIEVQNIWNEVTIKNKYIPKLYDMVWINITEIRGKEKFTNYYIFYINIDNIEVYINCSGHNYIPDGVYNFMERMGLGTRMQEFIYQGPPIEYYFLKWPNEVREIEKIL